MKSVKFSGLSDNIKLTVDVTYESGTQGNAGDDTLHKLLGVANIGRQNKKKRNNSDHAFIVLAQAKKNVVA